MKEGKIIIFSAPSGSGKSTIIQRLMQNPELHLGFSVSATSRQPRGSEQHGREYYFITCEEFKLRVGAGEFIEWEEVYPGTCYGTLRSGVERVIDVAGGVNVKKMYGDRALALFIEPPSLGELERRLKGRGTDAPEVVEKRLAKAEYELGFAPQYDAVIVNDDLETAVAAVTTLILDFINR